MSFSLHNRLIVLTSRVYIDDVETYFDTDASKNLILTDIVTGTKTLAELAAGEAAGAQIMSDPSATEYRIKKLRLNANKEIVVTYADAPGGTADLITSEPVSGEYRIKKLRLDNNAKGIIVTYDGTPES